MFKKKYLNSFNISSENMSLSHTYTSIPRSSYYPVTLMNWGKLYEYYAVISFRFIPNVTTSVSKNDERHALIYLRYVFLLYCDFYDRKYMRYELQEKAVLMKIYNRWIYPTVSIKSKLIILFILFQCIKFLVMKQMQRNGVFLVCHIVLYY
jgi:hypothetical protein